jgi:hypothetical protein
MQKNLPDLVFGDRFSLKFELDCIGQLEKTCNHLNSFANNFDAQTQKLLCSFLCHLWSKWHKTTRTRCCIGYGNLWYWILPSKCFFFSHLYLANKCKSTFLKFCCCKWYKTTNFGPLDDPRGFFSCPIVSFSVSTLPLKYLFEIWI